jgi:hypothetical protein
MCQPSKCQSVSDTSPWRSDRPHRGCFLRDRVWAGVLPDIVVLTRLSELRPGRLLPPPPRAPRPTMPTTARERGAPAPTRVAASLLWQERVQSRAGGGASSKSLVSLLLPLLFCGRSGQARGLEGALAKRARRSQGVTAAAAAAAALLWQKRASAMAVGGRPLEPLLRPSEASAKKVFLCGRSVHARELSGGDPPNSPHCRRGRTCARPHMFSAAHVLGRTCAQPHMCWAAHVLGRTCAGLHMCSAAHVLGRTCAGPLMCSAAHVLGRTCARPIRTGCWETGWGDARLTNDLLLSCSLRSPPPSASHEPCSATRSAGSFSLMSCRRWMGAPAWGSDSSTTSSSKR